MGQSSVLAKAEPKHDSPQSFGNKEISSLRVTSQGRRGSWGGEIGEFSPPLFLSPLLSFFFSYPSNIEIIFDFSDWGGENSPAISKSWIRACSANSKLCLWWSTILISSVPLVFYRLSSCPVIHYTPTLDDYYITNDGSHEKPRGCHENQSQRLIQ